MEEKLVTPQPFLDAIAFCASHGDTQRIRQLLAQPYHDDFLDDVQRDFLAKTQKFLHDVAEIEATHGEYSMIDLTHPRMRDGVDRGVIHEEIIKRSTAYRDTGEISAAQLWKSTWGETRREGR
jgi:hypothetical protein